MATQDTTPLKEKIISTLRTKGPALPVHIARETGQSILFASAFLSELVAEKKIKISNMRVGTSPVYFIPEQIDKLEKYSEYLKSKEKEAYLLLKEKKFLKDNSQEPAIRIALRAIKDFAIPFERESELIWRYFTVPESEYNASKRIKTEEKSPEPPTEKKSTSESIFPQATKLKIEQEEKPKKIEQEKHIQDEKPTPKPKPKKTASKKKSVSKAKQDKFFNTVKEYLTTKAVEITDIVGFSKTDMTLKVNKNGEKMIIAFNKKKVDEKDILKAHKIATEHNLRYIILALGDQTKKITNIIDAIKGMDSLEKIE